MTNPVIQLQELRAKMAADDQKERALLAQIVAEAKHTKNGQATYNLYGHKVTIKTGDNVTLDKAMLNASWNESMPINRTYAYALREKDYVAVMKSGSPELRRQLAMIVTTKPAKPSVKIGD